MKTNVFISGGGIAGLTLALKLVQQGVDVTVVEKEETPSIKYKGELLQPRSIEILTNIGLQQQLLAASHVIHATHLREQSKKHQLISLYYDVLEHPFNYALMVPHEELKQMILNAALQFEHFHYMKPATFIDFEESELIKRTAIIKDKHHTFHINADFFIGAEGRVSPVRKSLNISLQQSSYNHHFLTVSFPRPPSLTEGEMIVQKHKFLGLFPLGHDQVRTVYLIKPDEYKQFRKAGLQELFDRYIELYPALKGYVEQIPDWKSVQLMIPVRHNALQYFKGNCALMGDAAHSVHPMAGEGMNLAIQDADILGELLGWMYKTNNLDSSLLHWYEDVRKPQAEFLSKLSHQSALAYSYSNVFWQTFRINVLQKTAATKQLHVKQMLNISGLGIWKESFIDRLVQANLLPSFVLRKQINQQQHFFTKEDYYPWYTSQ